VSQLLDELRAAAEAEFAASRAVTPTVEPVVEEPAAPVAVVPVEPEAPAVPVEPVIVPVDEPEPVEPKPANQTRRVVYTKTVDLGDGSQPQVFKAATKDELIEKIFNAQVNASKRIHQLKEENRKLLQQVQPDPEKPVRGYEPRTLTQEEELELVNDLQTNPSNALGKAIEALLGAPLDVIKEDLSYGRQAKQKDSIREIGQQFLAAHPEYPVTSQNEKRMAEYIQKNKLAWTLKNLELAFSDLVEARLVTPTNAEQTNNDDVTELVESEQPVIPQAPVAVPPVIPAKPDTTLVEVPRRRKTVVGITSSQSVATDEPEVPREVSVEDLLKMSADARRRIVLAQMARQA